MRCCPRRAATIVSFPNKTFLFIACGASVAAGVHADAGEGVVGRRAVSSSAGICVGYAGLVCLAGTLPVGVGVARTWIGVERWWAERYVAIAVWSFKASGMVMNELVDVMVRIRIAWGAEQWECLV